MKHMLRVEFHCHTSFSKDCLVSPHRLVECGARKGLDRVVVTDHNTIAGALATQELDPGRVIVGEEIMTTRGEVLAAFVRSEIPPGLSPQETITRLREQGAFISISHPFDAHRKGGWQEQHLLEVLALVDAIETYNSRCMWPGHNRLAHQFADTHGVAGTVGSDAHTCWELGRSTLELPLFGNAGELRQVIRQGRPYTRWSPPWIHVSSRYAVVRKRMHRSLDTTRAA
jgi:hypothetical protein